MIICKNAGFGARREVFVTTMDNMAGNIFRSVEEHHKNRYAFTGDFERLAGRPAGRQAG